MISLWKLVYRPVVRRAAHQIMMGREVERGHPGGGRFLRRDVDALLDETWQRLQAILPEADLARLPTLGSRHNVFLAALTVSAYRAFVDAGIERDYAIELFADVGWKVYAKLLPLPRAIARLVTRDPQRRMSVILRLFMLFPFSTPGRPAYECKAWAEPGAFCTYWTHCPPYAFVKRLVERHGDHGELDAFRRSWCAYDWALAAAMVDGGRDPRAHYERPHTLSAGDDVCDMRWVAVSPPASAGGSGVRSGETRS
jgi:hypothetical protein